jgi:hypothetical protein
LTLSVACGYSQDDSTAQHNIATQRIASQRNASHRIATHRHGIKNAGIELTPGHHTGHCRLAAD